MSQKITVLGMGAMGSRMALRLLDAGYEVTVWNRTESRTQPLVTHGAKAAKTPKDAAIGADIIISMVGDDDASLQVWSTPETGALAGLAPGTIAIESSTITPDRAKEWEQDVQGAEGYPVEAPVSGSLPQVETGSLVYFLGGNQNHIETAKLVLSAIGNNFYPVGPIGSASVIKLATNSLLAIQIGIWSELLPMISQAVDLDTALDALKGVAAFPPVANSITTLMRNHDHAPRFAINMIEKDMRYVTSLVEDGKLPLLSLMQKQFADAIKAGLGGKNMTALVELSN